jgi:hypothetical protein
MNLTPKTESELQKESLFPKGEYSFEVMEAKETTSKSGNDMIKIKLNVFDNDSERSQFVYDYLMEAMHFKLRHFCCATGLISNYEAGSLKASDCVGKTGVCRLKIKEDLTGEYPPKNEIADYVIKQKESEEAPIVKSLKEATKKSAPVAKDMADDDIPF